ncbi:MAG: glycosyltransferase [Gemmatimonadota bacterium]
MTPRVLVVTNMFPTASRPYFGIFVQRQIEALRRVGADVRVESVAGARGESDYLLGGARLRRAIREFSPALIHYHYGYTPLAGLFTRIPYIVTLCGDDINGASDGHGGTTVKSRVGVGVTRLLAAGARRIIVKSVAMRQRLSPAAARKTDIIPNGVATDIFSPGSRTEARARLGVPPDTLTLAFVNSIGQPTKRLDLAEAVRDELLRRGVPAHLLVAESVAPEEMPWFYRAADCLLMTSDREGAPNCVKEALACGVPIVGVAVGDLPELLTTAVLGRIVARDPARLADAVVALAPRPDTPPSLLPAKFSDAAIAARVAQIYASVAARH